MTLDPHLRVLLVEDNDLDARSVTRSLAASTDADYELVHVVDLQSALERIEAEAFDCILLDLSLPDSEGLVPVETLSLRSPHAPVVVLTGLDDPDVAVKAVERGAEDYLTKATITPELIERAIRYAVARHHSQAQLESATDLIATMHDRERIARDLHDTVIQRLFATGMSLQALANDTDLAKLQKRTSRAVDDIDDAIRELREAIFGLNTVRENVSLASDIARTIDAERNPLGFMPDVRIGPIHDLGGDIHHAVVSVVREALVNVARHANATAVDVTVGLEDAHLVVRVVDNGTGPNAQLRSQCEAYEPGDGMDEARAGYGLRNLAARAEQLGGRFIFGPGPAGGFLLEWAVPLEH